VRGQRPWSAWKIALAAAAGLIVAGILGYLLATQQASGGPGMGGPGMRPSGGPGGMPRIELDF
jgi:hypothetical protein